MIEKENPCRDAGATFSPRQIKTPNRDQVKLLSQGQWNWILQSLGIPPQLLNKRHGPCPGCGGKDRFRFDDKEEHGTFFCNTLGKGGDGFALLEHVHGWSFTESLANVSAVLGGTSGTVRLSPVKKRERSPRFSAKNPNPKIQSYNEWLGRTSEVITSGCPADLYLKSRRLDFERYPTVLKCHPSLNYKNTDGELIGSFPAMVARIQDAQGQTVGFHRTYLTQEGKKAPVDECKRWTPQLYPCALTGSAIKLWEPSDELCIAEGIETAMAMMKLFDVPAWSILSSSLLPFVDIPSSVKLIHVGVDNDPAGRRAALLTAERFKNTDVEVEAVEASEYLDRPGADWADVLMESKYE